MTATYKNAVLIYNPRAGRFGRDAGPLIDRVVGILSRGGRTVTAVPTTGPKTAGAIACNQIGRGADLILAAGGDGTINEVAEGMVHSAVPLAILPAGTANVLATEMKLAKRFEEAAARLESCRPCRISVGRVTCDGGKVTRHFLLMAGIGLDADVVYRVSGPLKARTGKFAYWVAGWSLAGRRLGQIHAEIDGGRHVCSFALFSKVRNYGGDFEIAKNVSLFDDRFEAVLFRGRSSLPYVKYLLGMVLNRLDGMKGVTVLKAERAVLSCPEDRHVYVQIDGEYAGHLPAEVEIVPDALTLMVPPEYGRRE